jgi:hypothetical protein
MGKYGETIGKAAKEVSKYVYNSVCVCVCVRCVSGDMGKYGPSARLPRR